MLDILAITGPIYLCIALGWLATRTGLFERGDMRVLGQFVLYIALPALLFDAVGKRPIGDILDWHYLGVYALGGWPPSRWAWHGRGAWPGRRHCRP